MTVLFSFVLPRRAGRTDRTRRELHLESWPYTDLSEDSFARQDRPEVTKRILERRYSRP